ncbi:MAG: hypothetical protein E8D45_11760, partial [Nitrospira sp.]
SQKADILARHGSGRGKVDITRFKGLGEMMPKVLWETTMNPRTRRLLKVEIVDQIATDRIINELMGKDPSARFRFILASRLIPAGGWNTSSPHPRPRLRG